MTKPLTLADFTRTGVQDCCNVFSYNEHFEAWKTLGRPTDREAAINVVRLAWGEDDPTDWIKQFGPIDDFEGLDPIACFNAWRDAWQAHAASIVRDRMPAWLEAYADSL